MPGRTRSYNITSAEFEILKSLQRNGPGIVDPQHANALINQGLVAKKGPKLYAITYRGQGVAH